MAHIDAMVQTDSERIEAIAASIMRYLGIRPQSADTVEGIHRWWVDWGRLEEPIDMTESALRLLAERGEMESASIAGRTVWRRKRSAPTR